MNRSDLTSMYRQLKTLLMRNAKGPVAGKSSTITSPTVLGKPGYSLYGKKEVAIGNRKPQQTYIAGIIEQKHFVGFYSMGIYSHPKLRATLSPELKKFLKGKSCINVTRLSPAILKELDHLVKATIKTYKKEGWI